MHPYEEEREGNCYVAAMVGGVVLAAVIVLLVTLTSCASGAYVVGPDPMAGHGFRGVAHVNGDFDAQAFAEQVPVTALVHAFGNATVTLRAYPPPFLVLDGDFQLVVEPLPGKEAEAIRAVQRGEILIRRNGVPGALNRVGTAAAFKAALIQAARAAEQQQPISCVGEACSVPEVP